MENQELETLYFLACSGDQIANAKLLDQFVKIGKVVAGIMLNVLNVKDLKEDDFYDEILALYPNVLNNYNPESAKFKTYANLILERRLRFIILKKRSEGSLSNCSLDEINEDSKANIEIIEDKSIRPVPEQISINKFLYEMSSPKGKKNGKLRNNINALLYAGYSYNEVCKILKITLNQLRYSLRKNKTDKELANLKLEIK